MRKIKLALKIAYDIFCSVIYTLYYKIVAIKKMGINEEENREKKVIVSFTSFPRRFSNLDLVVKSIMMQSMKADKIILYLGSDSKNVELPSKLLSLKEKGLEIIYRDEDLKSHKKYYYAFQDYPNDIVITVDDDLVYEKDMIKLLVDSYNKYPNSVSAKRVHRMKVEKNGKLAKYNDWQWNCEDITQPSLELVAIGCGAILYPPNCMDKKVFDKEKILNQCLKADDIWLKFMQILKKTPVVYVKGRRIHPVTILGSQKYTLNSINVEQNQNDVYIQNLENEFGVELAEFCMEECLEEV